MSLPPGVIDEFETVEALLKSSFPTGHTDSFIIAWVKSEKQVRRIFTYLVYQFPVFSIKDTPDIISLVASKHGLYFENFIAGFDALYPRTFKDVVGPSEYDRFHTELGRIKQYRNKILHGQPTGQNLTAHELTKEINTIRNWCALVARTMKVEIGFVWFRS